MRPLVLCALIAATATAALAQPELRASTTSPSSPVYRFEGGAWRIVEVPATLEPAALPAPMVRAPAAAYAAARMGGVPYLEPEHMLRTVAEPSPYPALNRRPSGPPAYAGDVNGDGRSDFLYTGTVRDERTDDLADETAKTLLYFGPSLDADPVPDQLLYERLQPVGDLNGDGFDDALGVSEGGGMYLGGPGGYTRADAPFAVEAQSFKGFFDLDGDGYDDAIRFRAFGGFEFSVFWGAEDPAALSPIEYELDVSNSFGDRGVAAGDFDGDGATELVFVQEGGPNNTWEVTTVAFDAERRLVVEGQRAVSDPYLSQRDLEAHALDADGDGDLDLLLRATFGDAFLLNDGGFVAEVAYDSPWSFVPAGDLDGDGFPDFYRAGAEEPVMVFGPLSFPTLGDTPIRASRVEALPPPSYPGAVRYTLASRFDSRHPGYGDLDGDGRDEFVLPLDAYGSREELLAFGRLVLGYDSGGLTADAVYYDAADFPTETVIYASGVGDANGDGYPDFALGYFGSNAGRRVSLYYGGEAFPTAPALALLPGDSSEPTYQTVGGDFDADGFEDVATLFLGEENGIRIYSGGPSLDDEADHKIPYANVGGPGVSAFGISTLVNAGDLNGDGVDDLAFTAYEVSSLSELSSRVFVVYGGPDISKAPDLTLDLSGLITSIRVGARLLGGDFNGDGHGDLAVSEQRRENEDGRTTGVLYVFEGSARGLTNVPAFTLYPSVPDDGATYRTRFPASVEAGDFNGDGFTDIVATLQSNAPLEEGTSFAQGPGTDRAVHVFFGGPDFDAEPDALFGVPAAAFGLLYGGFAKETPGELTRIPDLDGDGADELLLGTEGIVFYDYEGYDDDGVFYTNAALVAGGDSLGALRAVLEAPNPDEGLGSYPGGSVGHPHSPVGDFDGDGMVEVLLPQFRDNNDGVASSRIYAYEIGRASGDGAGPVPPTPSVRAVFPNPTRGVATVRFSLPEEQAVRLAVYDVLGREVTVLVDEVRAAGRHTVAFDGRGLAAGVYLVRVEAGGETDDRRMTLLR